MIKRPSPPAPTTTAIVAAIVCASAAVFSALWSNHAAAQVKTPSQPPGFFKSGAENVRVAEILTDISVTLKQMDQRVERIEKLMAERTDKPIK